MGLVQEKITFEEHRGVSTVRVERWRISRMRRVLAKQKAEKGQMGGGREGRRKKVGRRKKGEKGESRNPVVFLLP